MRIDKLTIAILYKISSFYEWIFSFLGWEIKYDSAYDCYDWITHFHWLLVGPNVIKRSIINGRVVFCQNQEHKRIYTYIIASGFMCFYLILTLLPTYECFKKNMALSDYCQVAYYVIQATTTPHLVYATLANSNSFEEIGIRHENLDAILEQLQLFVNYRINIPLILILVTFIHISSGILFTTCIYFVCKQEYSAAVGVLYVIPLSNIYTVNFIMVGNFFIGAQRFWECKKYLNKIKYNFLNITNESYLYERHSIYFAINTLLELHQKQYELAKLTLDTLRAPIFIFVYTTVAGCAFLIFLYIHYNIFSLPLFLIALYMIVVLSYISVSTQLFRVQGENLLVKLINFYTNTLKRDLILARGTLCLQEANQGITPLLSDIIPVTPGIVVWVLDNTINLVIFLLQLSWSSQKN